MILTHWLRKRRLNMLDGKAKIGRINHNHKEHLDAIPVDNDNKILDRNDDKLFEDRMQIPTQLMQNCNLAEDKNEHRDLIINIHEHLSNHTFLYMY